MFLGRAFTPIFGSTWHGMPHSKHSNTIGCAVVGVLVDAGSFLAPPFLPR